MYKLLTTKQVKSLRSKLSYYVPNIPEKHVGDLAGRSGYLRDQLDKLVVDYIKLKQQLG